MTTAPIVLPVVTDEPTGRASEYERLADLFARIYSETHSIAATLELLDAERARAPSMPQVIDLDLPDRVVEIAASFFHVKPARRLLRPDRHRDICHARWIASWLLRQQGWSTPKIGRCLSLTIRPLSTGSRGS